MNSTFKRLGDYIHLVDIRNIDLKVSNLIGVNLQKQFMPSVANTIGTDMSKYKLINYNQFGCKLMSVGRDGKLPISLYKSNSPSIISSAYYVFEVNDENILNPDFLFMWIKRDEFDRELWFNAGADVRGGTNWENVCDMPILVPPIEEQRRIVAEYQAIEQRIENNRQLITKLEQTAQTIYRKMFVDDIDPENLPSGWRMGKFTDLFKLGGGGTPATSIKEYWNGNVPLFSPEDVKDTFLVSKTVRNITEKGLNKCNSQLYPIYSSFLTVRGTVGKIGMNIVPMAMNQSCYAIICKLYNAPFFTYCSTKHCVEVLKKQAVGAVFNAMVTRDFEVIDYIIPSLNDIEIFENQVYKIFNHIHNLKLELDLTKNLLNLLTSKLSKN